MTAEAVWKLGALWEGAGAIKEDTESCESSGFEWFGGASAGPIREPQGQHRSHSVFHLGVA
jgi:hypothetical protein